MLQALPLNGLTQPFEVSGVIGSSAPLTNGSEKLMLEFTGLRVINVENFSGDSVSGTDVHKVDLRTAIENRLRSGHKTVTEKVLRNVGPSISYKLRDASGQAVEYNNYMLPIEIDGARMYLLGLFVFFYACLHLLAYAWFDQELVLAAVVDDVIKRPFILVGMFAWSLLLLLAATSFNRAVRWLGARRWQMLHRAVCGIAGLAVLHFFWMRSGKNDFAEVAVYAAILSSLLVWRVWRWVQGSRRSSLSR